MIDNDRQRVEFIEHESMNRLLLRVPWAKKHCFLGIYFTYVMDELKTGGNLLDLFCQ